MRKIGRDIYAARRVPDVSDDTLPLLTRLWFSFICSLRVLFDDREGVSPGVRFKDAELIGVPTIVGALRLPEHVAMPDALELLLTGDPIDAEHARAIGLAWRVHPHDELLAEARALADRLCQEEGLFCGMSSGANVWAAIELARTMKRGSRIVTVLVDRRDRYFAEYPHEHYVV